MMDPNERENSLSGEEPEEGKIISAPGNDDTAHLASDKAEGAADSAPMEEKKPFTTDDVVAPEHLAPLDELPNGIADVVKTKRRPVKGLGSRIRSFVFGGLVVIYILAVLGLGYWYWTRPVRPGQFTHAYNWWFSVAEIYNIPVPKDERYQ